VSDDFQAPLELSTRGPDLEPEHLTDLGNARRFVRLCGADVRYVAPLRQWIIWDGARWAPDEVQGIFQLAKHVVAGIYAEAGFELEEARRKPLAQHALRSESVRALQAMITLAQSEATIPVRPEQLDADPWLLNCANGTIELKTGTLRPHRRADLITKVIPIAYDAAASCPAWLTFLARVLDDHAALIDFVQRAVGYSLTGSTTEQCLFVLWGSGANGKSTFVVALTRVLAAYAATMDANTLLARKGDDLGARNDLATLAGIRFAAAMESDMGRRLAEALVKQITGGDHVKVRRLYADPFEILPAFKIFLSTNHKPLIRGTDNAIWRRLRLIPFNVVIPDVEQDHRLLEKLAAEAPGILAWAVQGCLAWQRDGLGLPEEVRTATAAYRGDMDLLADFLGDRCIVDPMASVTAADLYAAYLDWAQQAGEKPLSQKALGGYLRERGFEQIRTGALRGWVGLRLREPLEPEA
jgi:putative DNA primase/helicase